MDYHDYIQSPQWAEKRREKLALAVHDENYWYCCSECLLLVPRPLVQIHHATYERLGFELMEDLEVLCEGCHAVHHRKPAPEWWIRSEHLKRDTSCISQGRLEEAIDFYLASGFHPDDALKRAICGQLSRALVDWPTRPPEVVEIKPWLQVEVKRP